MAVISHKTVQTRKEHTCFGCGREIPKGSKMEVVTSADSGTLSTDYWCNVCQSYCDKNLSPGDEIGFAELRIEDKEGWEKERKLLEENNSENEPALSVKNADIKGEKL